MKNFENKKCLVVDDYNTGRKIILSYLKEMGFNCYEAQDGNQGMAVILQNNLDLVIADVNMPKKNGLDLLTEIRNDDVLNNLPFILTMLEPIDDIISAAKALSVNEFLIKPFDVFTLSKVLDKVVKLDVGEVM